VALELKAVEGATDSTTPIFDLSEIRGMANRVINFNMPVLKKGIKRMVHNLNLCELCVSSNRRNTARNSEYRNPNFETVSMINTTIPNQPKSDSGFDHFPDFGFIELPVCFGFRASSFEFDSGELVGVSLTLLRTCLAGEKGIQNLLLVQRTQRASKKVGIDSEAGVDRKRSLLFELSRNKPMMGADAAVVGTKRDTASRAVSYEKTVERVASPVESQSMANYGRQRDVVDREPCVIHHCIRELRVANGEASDLSEKLDLQEGNRGNAPGAIPIQPRKFTKSFRAEYEPDQKVGIEKKGHRFDHRRETRPRSGRQSQDHRSAFSASGTRRSRLYCRAALAFRELATSSRRSTSRCPLRCTAITSPSRASSRRRNQCFLASDAVTFFMCTMYKMRRWVVKVTGGEIFITLTHCISQRTRGQNRTNSKLEIRNSKQIK
jgi:hypothetical protein